jgi:hypothetical protein
VWRLAFPEDLVCVTPDRRDQARADNAAAASRRAVDPATLPEAQRPGQHTIVLEVDRSQVRRSSRVYPPTCRNGSTSTPTGRFAVGWSQFEADGDPCQAGVVETAVKFDQRPLDAIPDKVIDRAVLTYGEAAAQGCVWSGLPGTSCWRGGSGAPEVKANGCVAKLAFPTVDWVAGAPAGLLPHTTFPQVKRTTPTEWEVSDPFRWQYTRSAPLGGPPPPPHGFLLSGGVSLNQLTAEDSTHCLSALSGSSCGSPTPCCRSTAGSSSRRGRRAGHRAAVLQGAGARCGAARAGLERPEPVQLRVARRASIRTGATALPIPPPAVDRRHEHGSPHEQQRPHRGRPHRGLRRSRRRGGRGRRCSPTAGVADHRGRRATT